MDAKTIIAIVLVVFIVGAAVWLNIRNSLQRKSQAPNGTCCKEIWQKVGRKKCSTNKPPQSAGLKREKRK